ncbi:MAG: hypothetical protein WD768_02945 [Phycisphaeraceae bacterium]
MLSLFAQAPAGPEKNLLEVMTGVFSRPDTLAHPGQILEHLQQMSVIWSLVLLAGGLMCLLSGYKFYKPVTVVLALLIGACVGWAVAQRLHAEQTIVAGCVGALLAATCMPLMKYAVAVMGGLTGAFIGANAWAAITRISVEPDAVTRASEHYWVGALIGLIVFGMLAFILFKLSVVMFTSVSGSTLAVLGAMALLLQVPQWQSSVTKSLSSHTIVLPLLVLVPAMIGLILQEARPDKVEAPAKKG